LGTDEKAVVAPAAAIQEAQNGTYAFVIDANDTAVQRPVQVLRTTPTLALIKTGLVPGERVVTDGQVRLQDGTKVVVQDVPSPARTASDASPELSP
jgi:multidrug efflux system membrane fusion protein